jgi:hypothetical protein
MSQSLATKIKDFRPFSMIDGSSLRQACDMSFPILPPGPISAQQLGAAPSLAMTPCRN